MIEENLLPYAKVLTLDNCHISYPERKDLTDWVKQNFEVLMKLYISFDKGQSNYEELYKELTPWTKSI